MNGVVVASLISRYGLVLATSILIASCDRAVLNSDSATMPSSAMPQKSKLGLEVPEAISLRAFRHEAEHPNRDGFVNILALSEKAPFAAAAIRYAEEADKRIFYATAVEDRLYVGIEIIEVYSERYGGLSCRKVRDTIAALPGDLMASVKLYGAKTETQQLEITGPNESCCSITRDVDVRSLHLYNAFINFSVAWDDEEAARTLSRNCIAAALDYPVR